MVLTIAFILMTFCCVQDVELTIALMCIVARFSALVSEGEKKKERERGGGGEHKKNEHS